MITSVSHDSLFKFAFSDPEAVTALVFPSLPSALVKRCDWSQLRPALTENLDDELRKSHCDAVFTAPISGLGSGASSPDTLMLHLHMEHQSTSDPSMVLRSLSYCATLLLTHHRVSGRKWSRPRPPLVVPVVVSHAPGGWKAALSLDELYELDEELEAQVRPIRTQHRYLLIDLAKLDDDGLRERATDAFRHLVLFALREGRNAQVLQKLRALAGVIETLAQSPNAGYHFWLLTCYLSSVSSDPNVTPQAVNDKLSGAGPASRAVAGSNFEKFMNELLDEGREAGRAEGLREGLLIAVGERFGVVTAEQKKRIDSAGLEQLQAWFLELGASGSLDELLDS